MPGAKAGDERTLDVRFPDDYPAEHLRGRGAQFAVTVREVKRKKLPELDDELRRRGSGFDSLENCARTSAAGSPSTTSGRSSASSARRCSMPWSPSRRRRARGAGARARTRALGADAPPRSPTRGSRGGLPADLGRDEHELHRGGRARGGEGDLRARRSRRGVEAEAIEPAEERAPGRARADSRARAQRHRPKLLKRLRNARPPGRRCAERWPAVRRSSCWSTTRRPITVEQAQARDKLWTPGKEPAGERAGDLWTPGS